MLNNTSYTPSSIGEIKFRIPLYQRPYAWEQVQVKQLLEDLYVASKTEQHYFIGIMSVCKTESDQNRYDLIDGQQRITTLMLIGKALKDEYNDWKNFLDDRLELYGRKEDSDFLNSFGTNPNPKMLTAVATIKDFFEKEVTSKNEFSKYIYEHTAFFLSEIPADYSLIDKNNHFVRMNHRGKQLEQVDILKVKLGAKLSGVKQTNFFEKWNKWAQLGCGEKSDGNSDKEKIIEVIKNDNESKLRPEHSIYYESIVSFSDFLLIALDRFVYKNKMAVKISHNKDKLLGDFGFSKSNNDYGLNEEYWDEDKVEAFSDFVDKQYESFVRFFIRKDKTERYTWFSVKEESDDYLNLKERNSSYWNKLKIFQSYLYVCTEPNKWMIGAFNWLQEHSEKEKEQNNFSERFLQKLKNIDNCNHGDFPTSYEYDSIGNYWFRRLDYYLWEKIFDEDVNGLKNIKLNSENKQLSVVINKDSVCRKFAFRNNSPSVEHLHPQDESQCNDKWSDKSAIDGFGNLALISQGLNSYQSNKPVEEKFGKLENILNSANGVMDSMKLYLMFVSAKANQGKWNPELAKAHGECMVNFLKKTFETT